MKLRRQSTGPRKKDGERYVVYMFNLPKDMGDLIWDSGVLDYIPSFTDEGILLTPVQNVKTTVTTPRWLKK